MNYESLEKEISYLRKMLSSFSIEELCHYSLLEMSRTDPFDSRKSNLHAPFKQVNYIISLALSIAEDDETLPLDEKEWMDICQKANNIYHYYGFMYFQTNDSFSLIEKNDTHKKMEIALAAFILDLSVGVCLSAEQIKEDIFSIYAPFSKDIESKIGISVVKTLSICDFIASTLQRKCDNALSVLRSWMKYKEDISSGLSNEETNDNVMKVLTPESMSDAMSVGLVSYDEIIEKFPIDGDTFINLFSQERSSQKENREIILPTEELSISLRPIIQIDDKNFTLITGNHLFLSVQERLYRCIADLKFTERYNARKSAYLEERTLNCFKMIFGNGAKYYVNFYEKKDKHNEHDLIIVYKRTLLIIECKAKKIRKNFRDVEKSVTRIKDDFKKYIQEGYDQALNLEKLILSQRETRLYGMREEDDIILQRDKIECIEKIIVTYDNEGSLATDLSFLLKTVEDNSFPLCICVRSLRQLSEYGQSLGLTPERFLDYLSQRKLIHGKIVNYDELDILGFFLEKGDLNLLIQSSDNIYQISSDFSKKFDQAYIKEKYHTPFDNGKKVGRNDLCPCGSSKKYKKCCLVSRWVP